MLKCLEVALNLEAPLFKVVLRRRPDSVQRRNDHGQVGHGVPELGKVK